MDKKQEQQILDYYSTTDKYIRSKTHSNAHQSVYAKESDKFQWVVLKQKIQCEVEVRQTDNHGIITAMDNHELTRNLPKCVGVERLCEGANVQIAFNADEINFGLSGIVKRYGFQTIQAFCKTFAASKTANADYRDKADKWEERYGEKSQKQEESVYRRLQNYQRENTDRQTKQTSKSNDRGAR